MHQLKIGWARRDISTTKPVNIPGQFHIRVSEGILDPLTLTALVLDDGEHALVMVSVDTVLMLSDTIKLIRARLAALCPEVDASRVIIHATHTHAAAANYDGMAKAAQAFPVDPSITIEPVAVYRDFLAESAASAVAEAWRRRAPGGYAYGYGYAVVGHSRKTWYFDDLSLRPEMTGRPGVCVNGHARMYGQTNDPMFSHYEAGADHFVNLLFTFDQAGSLTGAIVNVACPSQCSEGISRLSASFWHETRQMLRARFGDIDLLPQCAPAGDISPRILHYKDAQARRFQLKFDGQPEAFSEQYIRHDIAERLAAAFAETLAWARQDVRTQGRIETSSRKLQLPARPITDEEYQQEKALYDAMLQESFQKEGTPRERLTHDSVLAARRERSLGLLERYEEQRQNPFFTMELHVAALDEVGFAVSPFELYMDYMHRIQARSPFVQTFNIQLGANEYSSRYSGYLPTERAFMGKGYSASRYCNMVGPEGGQVLVEETLGDLRLLHDRIRVAAT
jgi:hypothetical protein